MYKRTTAGQGACRGALFERLSPELEGGSPDNVTFGLLRQDSPLESFAREGLTSLELKDLGFWARGFLQVISCVAQRLDKIPEPLPP